MKIVVMNKTKEQFLSRFSSQVVRYERFDDWKSTTKLGAYIGNISQEQFWIAKTRSIPSNLPQRFFKGSIIENTDSIQITGRFLFPDSLYVWCAILSTIFLAVILGVKNGTEKTFVDYIVIVFLPITFTMILPVFGLLTSIHLERDVIRLIKEI